MGKDFTPQQLLAADRLYGFSKKRLVLKSRPDGEETVLYDPHSKETGRWPNISFLLGSPWFEKAVETAARNGSQEELDKFERLLVKVINEESLSSEKDSSAAEITEMWFYGRLDRNFYYCEQNNRMYLDFLLDRLNAA